jgi:hypothetical protein
MNNKNIASFTILYNKTNTKKIISGIIYLVYIFILADCASLHAYMYVLTQGYDGNAVLQKEGEVKEILEGINENAEKYSIKAYTRTAISYKVKKTKETTHSFYIIMDEWETYQTLSFSATGKWATSEGAWAINTDSDITSYEEYVGGENRWHVKEIEIKGGINTIRTITNILNKINKGTTYYYRAKENKEDTLDNCNTALLETLVENENN